VSKLKRPGKQTAIPKRIEIELLRIMRDNKKQIDREVAAANSKEIAAILKEYENYYKDKSHKPIEQEMDGHLPLSRDTFKRLENDIFTMPPNEVYSLPKDLQDWIVGQRPELKEEIDKSVKLQTNKAVLEFSKPIHSKEEGLGPPSCFLSGDAVLYRLELKNIQPNTIAEKVSVKILHTVLETHIKDYDLHRMHNNKPPYDDIYNLRGEESITFDVIARRFNEVGEPEFYIHRGGDWDTDTKTFLSRMSPHEEELVMGEGLILVIKAIPAPPVEGTGKKYYKAFIDANGAFILEEKEETK